MQHVLILAVFLCSFVLSLEAQEDSISSERYFQFGLGLTGFSYLGDFSNDLSDIYRINPGGNLSLQTVTRSPLQFQANIGIGSFAEQIDQNSPTLDSDAMVNRFVETAFYYGDFRLKYRFFHKRVIQPYLSAGAGILVFSPKDESGKELIRKPETRAPGETYNTTIPQLPATIGLQARITPLVAVSIDYTYRLTPSDYLDNVGQWGSQSGDDALHNIQASLYFSLKPKSANLSPRTTPPSDPAISYQETGNSEPGIQEGIPTSSEQQETAPPSATAPTEVYSTASEPEQAAPVSPASNGLEQEKIAREETAIRENRYIYYEIQEGDQLDQIAEQYEIRRATIVELNYLGNRTITAGMFLRLPDVGLQIEQK